MAEKEKEFQVVDSPLKPQRCAKWKRLGEELKKLPDGKSIRVKCEGDETVEWLSDTLSGSLKRWLSVSVTKDRETNSVIVTPRRWS